MTQSFERSYPFIRKEIVIKKIDFRNYFISRISINFVNSTLIKIYNKILKMLFRRYFKVIKFRNLAKKRDITFR